MTEATSLSTRLLAFIAVLAAIAALKVSYPVTMPIAFALVIIAAVWPIKPMLDRLLPSWLSYIATVLVMAVAMIIFGASIYYSIASVARALLANAETLERSYAASVSWVNQQGIGFAPVEGRWAMAVLQRVATDAYTFVFYLGFVGLVVVLGLPEVPATYRKLRFGVDAGMREDILQGVDEIADKVRKYLGVTVATSLLTGVASAIWSWTMGLELALTWGVLNFLLNFIPVIGNIIGIIPPTLYALAQFGDPVTAAIVFVGFVALQLSISNIVYPLLQGFSLSLSPVAIVIALAFWSWLWGIGGALIAVPLTAAIAIVCDGFERSRCIAKLLLKG